MIRVALRVLVAVGVIMLAVTAAVGAASPGRRAYGSGSPLASGGRLPATVPVVPVAASREAKLSAHLGELYAADQAARASNQRITHRTAPLLPPFLSAMAEAQLLRLDDDGRVQVLVQAQGDQGQAAAGLTALGMAVQRLDVASGLIQGMLPIEQLLGAAALPDVAAVRLPQYATVNVGSALTQGDTLLHASTLRSTFGVSGRGIRVGVISDGLDGLAQAQASGDLPASVDSTTCNIVVPPPSSPPAPQPLPTDPGAGAEGTAMLEIVHDLAPDAQLWFGYFGATLQSAGTPLDFNAAVNCLAANVDVVVDDTGWIDIGPYDGTSIVSSNTTNALNNPANRIRAYYTAAGNSATSHYREQFVSSGVTVPGNGTDSWVLHRFQATANTTDAGAGFPCTTFGGPAGYCGDTISVNPGGIFFVGLEWNDPFGSSADDYDLLFFDPNDPTGSPSGTLYLASTNRQTGAGSNPVEEFAYKNNHAVPTNFSIIIGNYKGAAAARTFSMFLYCTSCSPIAGNLHNFNTAAGSVASEGDAGGGVVALGAVNASSPGLATVGPYSSQGPTADGRIKPDAVAVDGVSVSGAGGFPYTFYGTSAAAPHAAGIAALLFSCNPMLLASAPGANPAAQRTTLRTALLTSAIDIGAPGVDNVSGYGRIDAMAAAPGAGCLDTDGDGYPNGVELAMGKDPNTYCAVMRADVNDDGWVNIIDMALIGKAFGITVPPTAARLDQNGDSRIDLIDMANVGKQFGKNVAACP